MQTRKCAHPRASTRTRAHAHTRTHVLSMLERNGYSRMLWYSGAPHAVGTTRYFEAIADFSAVICLDPSNANAYFNRGSVRLCARPCHVHLRRDRAHPCHICAGTALTPATSASGLRSRVPTSASGLRSTVPTSAPGLGAALEPVGTAVLVAAGAAQAHDSLAQVERAISDYTMALDLDMAASARRSSGLPSAAAASRADGASRDGQRAGGAGIARRGGRVASDLVPSQRRARESCLVRRSGRLRCLCVCLPVDAQRRLSDSEPGCVLSRATEAPATCQ
jgi:hypothetical protein